MAAVTLQEVSKKFGSVIAVDRLTIDIPDRAFVTLLGPSGCGKTTSLRLIAGLDPVTEGTIVFDGDDVTQLPADRRDIAMVFQSYALYPHMSVAQNMGFALRMMKVEISEIQRRVYDAAVTLGIDDLLDRRPWQLSGGQRQRVALGRAIVREPAVFLMDEPLSNLDVSLRVSMRRELKRLHQELGRTIVYVTHDQEEALALSDLIAIMDRGVLQQVGTPDEVYERPTNIFVARFVGSPSMNMLRGRIVEQESGLYFESEMGRLALGNVAIKPTADVFLGVRPEDLLIVDGGQVGVWTGELHLAEPSGPDVFVTVRLGDANLVVRVPRTLRATLGTNVSLRPVTEYVHLFNAATGRRL